MTTLAYQIAERIHQPRYEDVTPAGLEWTRTAFIDTVGVTLAGIVEGGGEPGLKAYPCCGSTRASINRMIHLARTHNVTPERVEKIEVLPHARRLPHTDNPDPRTPLGAKFSVQYVVARHSIPSCSNSWRARRHGRILACLRQYRAAVRDLGKIETIGTITELSALLSGTEQLREG
jgi:hypothetical protein